MSFNLKGSVYCVCDEQDSGVEPDMSTYAGLLYSCGQGGLHKAATKIHRHMLQRNVVPAADVFTGLANYRSVGFTFDLKK